MKIHLLTIDPQNDFCMPASNRFGMPAGTLFVPGADSDMERLTSFVRKNLKRIDEIHVTLDSHLPLHIAHGVMWLDQEGKMPDPFTIITDDAVERGEYRTVRPLMYDDPVEGRVPWGQHYTRKLKENGRYALCIWPQHCLIGSPGAAVYPEFFSALQEWQETRIGLVNYVTKGSNYKTEHYSAIRADVEDPGDPGTQLNMEIIRMLQDPEIADILITGEALSHCVANTISDIANTFGEENIEKFVLLEDTCSNVPGFEQQGIDFVNQMTKRGMRVSTTTDYA